MNAQAVIIKDFKLLMVRQYTKRGKIIWNFPGGGVEKEETYEQACMREVLEETGYIVKINYKLHENSHKITYVCEIIDGELKLNKELKENEDIIEIAWVDLKDKEKFDEKIEEILKLIKQK